MTISEKVAYLKGLAEGLGLDTEKSKEGKLISIMIGILEEVGLSIEDLEQNSLALGEEIDAISDGLADIEGIFDDLAHHHDHDCGCEDEFEYECPSCGTGIPITDQALDEEEVTCPDCNTRYVIDLDQQEAPFQAVPNEDTTED